MAAIATRPSPSGPPASGAAPAKLARAKSSSHVRACSGRGARTSSATTSRVCPGLGGLGGHHHDRRTERQDAVGLGQDQEDRVQGEAVDHTAEDETTE